MSPRPSPTLVALLLSALLPLAASRAVAAPDAYDAYEVRLDSTLHARDTLAQRFFRDANEARGRDPQRAIALYNQVLGRIPDFAPAARRRANMRLESGDRATAVSELRALLAIDSTAFTHSALAYALVRHESEQPLSFTTAAEAQQQVDAALRLDPDDVTAWQVSWELGAVRSDTTQLRRATHALQRLAPREPGTWFVVAAYRLGVGHDARAAEAAIDHAVALGMPQAATTGLRKGIAEQRTRDRHFAWMLAGVGVLVMWVLAFVLLLGIGSLLSRTTLRAAGRALDDPSGRAVGLSGWLRRTYVGVLWSSCALYYVSLPLLLVLTLGLGGGLVYASFALGHVPIKLVLLIVVVTFVTASSIVRSLLVRGRDEDPGRRLPFAEAPRLRAVLEQVAGRVGTRAVDTVFVTPGAELAVFERGGLRRQLRGDAERCLILGLGVLDGMTVRQLQSILAHEYGHFSNRDTAGGGFALSVRRSLYTMAGHLARGGAAGWYNPAWWFLRGFHAVFMRISLGASRLQEVLADRWAAVTYGSDAFVRGLRHVIEASVRFEAHANASVNEALEAGRPLPNLYRYAPTSDKAVVTLSEVPQRIADVLAAEPSAYDSHPTPQQRMAWVTALAITVAPEPGDTDPAWSLFPDRDALEHTLTAHLRGEIERSYGVQFATVDG